VRACRQMPSFPPITASPELTLFDVADLIINCSKQNLARLNETKLIEGECDLSK
jgi:hypothetical protein